MARLTILLAVGLSTAVCAQAASHTQFPPEVAVGKPTSSNAQANSPASRELAVARFYFLRGSYDTASFRYARARQLEPESPEATFGLALSLEKLGSTEQARELYQSYLRLWPAGANVMDSREALQRLKSPPVR